MDENADGFDVDQLLAGLNFVDVNERWTRYELREKSDSREDILEGFNNKRASEEGEMKTIRS